MRLNVFVPISKVDAAKGIVYGTLVAEEVDRSGEIFDYDGSKPYFQEWSSSIAKATDGKSVGNLRAMHGAVAAGKFTDIHFDDGAKRIQVAAKVVDKNELEKVLEGVYTGFSIGGRYIARTKKTDGVTSYICDPVEGSLVDLPCIPSATFSVVDAAGATIEKKFNPAGEVEKQARKLAKAAGKPEDDWTGFEADAIDSLTKTAATAPTNDEIAAKAREIAKAAGSDDWLGRIDEARKMLTSNVTDAVTGDVTINAPVEKIVEKPVDATAKAETPKAVVKIEGDDREPWEQVWKHPDLPGREYAKKSDLRAALVEARAKAAAAKAAAPITDAIKSIASGLDLREAVKITAADALEKHREAVFAAAGVTGDAVKAATIAADAVNDLSVHVSRDGKLIVDVPDALKAAIIKAVEALAAPAKKTMTDAEKAALAKSGVAMPDGSHPIEDRAALALAVTTVEKAGFGVSALKRHVVRRAAALKAQDVLPDDWRGPMAGLKVEKLANPELAKGAASLYTVSRLVSLLADVESAEESLEYGGPCANGVDVPKATTDRFGEILVELGDMVAGILDGYLAHMREREDKEAAEGAIEVMRVATVLGGVAKAAAAKPLHKFGARNSKADQSRINDAHDLLVDLGAECSEIDDEATEKTVIADLRKTVTAQTEAFDATLKEIETAIKSVVSRVNRIESQPLPEGTSSVTTSKTFRVVEKGAEDIRQVPGADNAKRNEAAYQAAIAGELARFGTGR